MRRMLILVLLILSLMACANSEKSSAPRIVASTAWTAAFVKAAGVEECYVLTPYEMQHPSEYELKPTDVKILSGARIFVCAGYETMMKDLASNASFKDITVIRIQTDFDPVNMKKSIMDIAAVAGTQEEARKKIKSLEDALSACKDELKQAGAQGKPAIVHSFQKVLAELFGLQVVGTFGPAPLEAKQIAELTKTGAAIIIDNWHNPAAGPIRETLPRAKFAEFINFPGKDNTRTLEDVLQYDKNRLLEILR